MDKHAPPFEDFLMTVQPEYQAFAAGIHESLLQGGYQCKIESKANGFLVSYAHPKTKRSLLNFLFRKKGLVVRLYPDPSRMDALAAFLDTLPESMVTEIGKASACKRLLNPSDCNSRCVMGYDISIRGTRYRKCRYSCFQFAATPESVPALSEFVALCRA